jgi:hypothetical protein
MRNRDDRPEPGMRMAQKARHTAAVLVALAALTTTAGISVAPAGATVPATNDRFCTVLSNDQGAGIDFEGLEAPEARLAAKVMRKAAKTGVPANLKADLVKIAAVYERIAGGKPAAEVLDAAHQKDLLPRLTRFGKYVAANCIATPST